jgi:hypothetical protein
MFNISFSDIDIVPYKKLLARLGFLQAKTKIDDKTNNLIIENLDFAKKLISPKFALIVENITVTKNIVDFESGYKIESYNLSDLFKGCFKSFGVAVTIGKQLELKRSFFIKEKETFKALILDACGAVAAEEIISSVNKQIAEIEKENSNELTRRYSCGYGDWTLDKNKDFLNWVGAEKIGITINDFFQMNPEKSITAIIGVKCKK